ncbi:MAG TPA: ABC transporter ATP-binding protein [Nitrososphaerales archaeon]|nr:ABC transporter ATP-binding protein [Nitrososphaerales archaeon]
MSSSDTGNIISVENLAVTYRTVYGTLKALDGIDLSVARGESVSIVGESGCGKSTLGLATVRLLPQNARYAAGRLMLDGNDVAMMSDREVLAMRGTTAFMIFQDPLNTLNPVKRIDVQMLEAIRSRCKHERTAFSETDALKEAVDKLGDIRMPDPDSIIRRYPHQLSGGQIQRIVIAMGLLMRPKLMIADEPTSALDVTVQAQVLKLMRELQREYNMSIIFITHDINVAYGICDRMVVMYAGQVVEEGTSDVVTRKALHPYSQALIQSVPKATKEEGRLTAIAGAPPNMLNPPKGCRFHPRCPYVMEVCRERAPPEVEKDGDAARCFLYGGTAS